MIFHFESFKSKFNNIVLSHVYCMTKTAQKFTFQNMCDNKYLIIGIKKKKNSNSAFDYSAVIYPKNHCHIRF